MLRVVVFAVVLVAACAVFIPGDTQSVESAGTVQYSSVHTFGKREQGDGLLASTKNFRRVVNGSFEEVLRYPRSVSGDDDDTEGFIVTYVRIDVHQANNQSTATIINGGIGQRKLSIRLTATNVTSLEFFSYVFGHGRE